MKALEVEEVWDGDRFREEFNKFTEHYVVDVVTRGPDDNTPDNYQTLAKAIFTPIPVSSLEDGTLLTRFRCKAVAFRLLKQWWHAPGIEMTEETIRQAVESIGADPDSPYDFEKNRFGFVMTDSVDEH